MTPDHLRDTALGRAQAASHLRTEATTLLTTAIRGAHAAGATREQIRIETGLTPAAIARVLKGRAL